MEFKEKEEFYKARMTALEMITDRGYTIPDIEKISFEIFIQKYDNKNIDIYIEDSEKAKKFYIYFHNESKSFSKSELKNIIQKVMNQYNDPEIGLVLILKEKENSAVSKELTKDMYKNVEIFIKRSMLFNISHHTFVPKHILLTQDEEKEILEKYNTTKSKLPKLLHTDPMAKYYNMKSDQICKIIRKSPEVGESITYRVVR